jgi:thiol-disulfide isomerase/thioredoxin
MAAPPSDNGKSKGTIKLMMVGESWCGWTKKIKPIFDEFAQTMPKKQNGYDIVVEYVDHEKPEGKEIAKPYNVKGFPTMILLKNGERVNVEIDRTLDGMKKAVINAAS